ncbi:MAG TPA: polymer-forming cytoskeletal protein [Gemmatimonadaceae bacterium]|nr:polymer-forming cytoskeletal protein [Gemmatimonadaceae bacterium]
MRALIALVALALGGSPAPAQTAQPKVQSAAPAAQSDTSHVATAVAERRAAGDRTIPNADHFTYGNRTVQPNTTVDGPIAIARGNLDVFGTVNGSVFVVDGDIRVHRGARVTGDAWSAAGSVIIDGGVVEGERRAINSGPGIAAPTPAPVAPARPLTTWQSVKLVIGWFALLAIIGIGVMVFAEANLDGVVVALERGFARAFWMGIAGQLLALPLLLVIVVALAITLIGVLLIPFAIVAYVIAAAGLVTLGFLAVSRLTGGAFGRDGGATPARAVHLRGLVIGLVVYLVMWLLAASLANVAVAGAVLRAIAIAVTWVAATLGLGATLVSRAGTERATGRKAAATDELAWQTPTPVSGVAAATRRPVSATK